MSPLIVIVTVAALLFYFWTGMGVGRMRSVHKIAAPAMTGNPLFERASRVQGNTLEWIVIFLPSMWIFGGYFDPRVAAGLGVVWIVGRVLYMRGYMADPAKRGPGFGIQALATLVLLVGSLVGAVMQIANGGF